MKYLALVPNYYGFGATEKAALASLRHEAGTTKGAAIYEVCDDYWIDDFGTAYGSAPAKLVKGKDLRTA